MPKSSTAYSIALIDCQSQLIIWRNAKNWKPTLTSTESVSQAKVTSSVKSLPRTSLTNGTVRKMAFKPPTTKMANLIQDGESSRDNWIKRGRELIQMVTMVMMRSQI